jgi:DNA-binding NarL/FixJ family response regulator
MNGDAEAAVRVAEHLLASPGVSPSARLDAEASLVLGYFLQGKEEAEKLSAQILQQRGTRPGDIAALMALTTQSNLLWRAGELSEALRLGRTAVRYGEDADPVWRLHFQLSLAGKLANLREFDKAASLITDVEAGLRGLPTPIWTAAPAVMRSRMFLQSGRIGDARREAELATAAGHRDAVPMLRPLAYSVLSTASFYMGNVPEAFDYLMRAQTDVANYAVLESVQYAWIEILITVKTQGPRAAAQLLSDKYSYLPTQRSLYIEVPSAAAFLVVLARDVGDSELARSVLETVDGLAADNPAIPVIGLTAVHANALANSAPAALALIIVQSPDPISVALATEQLAKLYSDKAPAAGLQAAFQHNHNHNHDFTLAHEEDGKHHACWSALSDMERRIAYMVSVGLTNRQIGRQVHLSAHTINYHLRKLYKKLGINTRVELAHGAATYLRRAAIYSMDEEQEHDVD